MRAIKIFLGIIIGFIAGILGFIALGLTLADDDLPFGDETVTTCDDETGVKCYSCGGYFPESSCIANTLDEGERVPVCESCAEGRVG